MTRRYISIGLVALFLAGCATAPKTSSERANLDQSAQLALNELTTNHPDIDKTLDKAYAYAIFPSVGAGGLVVGGAHGQGEVQRGGQLIGYASISQVSAGAEAGGESYVELIVFQDKAALDKLINNQLSLTGNAGVVVLKPGVAAATQFENGVAVFVKPSGGAMINVSVGGQRFTFQPVSNQG